MRSYACTPLHCVSVSRPHAQPALPVDFFGGARLLTVRVCRDIISAPALGIQRDRIAHTATAGELPTGIARVSPPTGIFQVDLPIDIARVLPTHDISQVASFGVQ